MLDQDPTTQLINILEQSRSHDYIGENVSQLEHALQAAHFASKSGAPDHEIIAALFHDIGHLHAPSDARNMDGFGIERHEHHGADFLASLGMPSSVTELVRSHVDVKRYLVARNPDYARKLSSASTETLRMQGGPMTPEECVAFEQDPQFKAKLRIRQWDEMAKVENLDCAPLEHYAPMIAKLL